MHQQQPSSVLSVQVERRIWTAILRQHAFHVVLASTLQLVQATVPIVLLDRQTLISLQLHHVCSVSLDRIALQEPHIVACALLAWQTSTQVLPLLARSAEQVHTQMCLL